MAFGVIRKCGKQRFRFYADDPRALYIRWEFAPPGAAWWTQGGPIHPFYYRDKYLPPLGNECGATAPWFTVLPESVRLGTDGQTPDGTDADFAGRGSVREVQHADGSFNPDAVPRCALPTAWTARDGSPDVAGWTASAGNVALTERAAWTASAYDRSPGVQAEYPIWTCTDASVRPARLLANPQHPPIDGWAQQET